MEAKKSDRKTLNAELNACSFLLRGNVSLKRLKPKVSMIQNSLHNRNQSLLKLEREGFEQLVIQIEKISYLLNIDLMPEIDKIIAKQNHCYSLNIESMSLNIDIKENEESKTGSFGEHELVRPTRPIDREQLEIELKNIDGTLDQLIKLIAVYLSKEVSIKQAVPECIKLKISLEENIEKLKQLYSVQLEVSQINRAQGDIGPVKITTKSIDTERGIEIHTKTNIGVELYGKYMDKYIPATAPIPCKESKLRTTASDNQSEVRFKVFEGDDELTENNRLLGEYELNGIQVAAAGISKFEVQLRVDANGVLNVTANDVGPSNSKQTTEEITFMDHIRSGVQIHFAVAIDFTASNGVYTDPNSLHYLYGNRLNDYQIALRSVGEIIRHYDRDLSFPAFGFGAFGTPSYQFPLNGKTEDSLCTSVAEMLLRYGECLQKFELCGPTLFSPVINDTISIAKQFLDGKHYLVLLLMTDGQINSGDIEETKHSIANASTLPISIIILGIGNSDFRAMKELVLSDSSDNKRDILQFVQLNTILDETDTYTRMQADLAKEVIEKIPHQLTSFMKLFGKESQDESEDASQDELQADSQDKSQDESQEESQEESDASQDVSFVGGMIPTAPNYL